MATLTIVAGPNGSGKSSITRRLVIEGLENLLDLDAVAKRMNPNDPGRAAVAAAREVILRTREYLESRQSFVVETTLSSGGTLGTMRQARSNGFIVHLVCTCLDTPDYNIRRVRERVERGGHDVPEADVRRRYERSLLNLPAALGLAHEGLVYDNSDSKARKVLETRNFAVVWHTDREPAWVARVRQAISSTPTP